MTKPRGFHKIQRLIEINEGRSVGRLKSIFKLDVDRLISLNMF